MIGVSIFVFGGAAEVVVLTSKPLTAIAKKATKAIKLLQLLSEDFLKCILYLSCLRFETSERF
jgi:hypothetical protein